MLQLRFVFWFASFVETFQTNSLEVVSQNIKDAFKTSSQTESKGPGDNVVLPNKLIIIYNEKETVLFGLPLGSYEKKW